MPYVNPPQPVSYSNCNISAPPALSPHDMEEEPPGVQLPAAPTGPPITTYPTPSRPVPPSASLPINPPPPPANSSSTTPSYDDLAARFAALKK